MSLGVWFWLGVLVALLFHGPILFEVIKGSASETYFVAALKSESVSEDVSLNGKVYLVVNGEVIGDVAELSDYQQSLLLRLAYAKAMARRRPLLALPGNNSAMFAGEALQLSLLSGDLADLQKHWLNKLLVKHFLFPDRYLLSLAKMEEARVNFLATGNYQDWVLYRDRVRPVASFYQRENFFFRLALQYLVEDKADYINEQYLVSKENSLRTFSDFAAKMDEVAIAWQARASCVKGDVTSCRYSDVRLPTVEPRAPALGGRRYDFVELMENHYENLYPNQFSQENYKNLSSTPYVELSHSYCLSRDTRPIYAWSHNIPWRLLMEMGDFRLVNNHKYYGDSAFNRYLVNVGISYTPLSHINYYNCHVVARDVGTTYTTLNVASFAFDESISQFLVNENDKIRASDFERKLGLEVITESDARGYVALGLEKGIFFNLPTTLQHKLIDLALQFNHLNTHTDHLLENIKHIENSNLLAVANGIPVSLQANFLFFVRGGFTSFSLIGLEATADNLVLFEPFGMPRDETPFVYLSEFIDDPAGYEALLDDLKQFGVLHGQ